MFFFGDGIGFEVSEVMVCVVDCVIEGCIVWEKVFVGSSVVD